VRKFERFISSFPAGRSLKGFGVDVLCRGIVLSFFPAKDSFYNISHFVEKKQKKFYGE